MNHQISNSQFEAWEFSEYEEKRCGEILITSERGSAFFPQYNVISFDSTSGMKIDWGMFIYYDEALETAQQLKEMLDRLTSHIA